jgi:hypothetical protein
MLRVLNLKDCVGIIIKLIEIREMSLVQQLCNCCARDKRHEMGPTWDPCDRTHHVGPTHVS